MTGAKRKMAVYLGLVEDRQHEDLYDHYEEDQDDGRDAASWSSSPPQDGPANEEPDEQESLKELFGTVFVLADQIASRLEPGEVEARLRQVFLGMEASSTQIVTLYPRAYNDARTIGEHFREGVPVVMDLTELTDNDARRLVDFAAGLIFGLRGNIERVTRRVFLLSPANIEITAEDKARIAERSFFNQA
jgi:cell division inhibitor SepF